MRRSLLLNGTLLVTAAGLAGGAYFITGGSPDAAASAESIATAKTGVVLSSVSATGNLEAPNVLGVNFGQSGRVTSISVAVGQHVDAGAEMARVDDSTQQSALASAKAQLSSAEAQLAAKRRGLTDAEKAQEAANLAQAQGSIDNAQRALDRAEATAAANATKYQQQVDQSGAQLAAQQQTAAQNKVKYQQQVDQAQAALTTAQAAQSAAQQTRSEDQAALRSLQTSYDPSRPSGESTNATENRYRLDQSWCQANSSATTSGYDHAPVTCAQIANLLTAAQNLAGAESGVTQAQSATTSAQNAFTTAQQNQTAGLVADQQQIDTAQRSVDNAKQSQTTGLLQDQQQVQSSEDSLANARATYASTTAGDAVKEAPAKAEDVAQAEASVASAQAQVDTATKNEDDTVLRAPIAGTVSSISGLVGDYASGGSASGSSSSSDGTSGFVVLTDVDVVDVKVGFSEADAAKVRVGQRATISIDATGGSTVDGTVVSLDVNRTLVDNVVTYYAKVRLDGAAAGVKPGMTASVSVVLDKRDDVVTLPTSAVPSQGTSTTVTVRDASGHDTPRTIAIGLRGDNAVEITSGLSAGDNVVTTTSSAAPSGGFAPPGGGLGGGLGGGPGGGR
jgi:multidrug efflux pump subunit AcrA (membrane-fusion protein)